jgi:hypothetical protein
MGGNGNGGGRTPTTVPPPFDPEEFARSSELALRVAPPASDTHSTAELPSAPPLNKRVSVNVPASDLAWFGLSEQALALAARMDGTKTLNDLMDSTDFALEAVGQLHDAGLLVYEE